MFIKDTDTVLEHYYGGRSLSLIFFHKNINFQFFISFKIKSGFKIEQK